jgi:hypothetical protein
MIYTVLYCMDGSGRSLPDALRAVRQVAVPPDARALSTLSHIDYEDAFLVETGPAQHRTAEQWARATLEGAPVAVRTKLLAGWSVIGLRVHDGRADLSVLGWEIRHSGPEAVVLGADSRIGMPGELLFKCERDALLFATFVQHDHIVARALWAGVQPRHVRVVRSLLERVLDQ